MAQKTIIMAYSMEGYKLGDYVKTQGFEGIPFKIATISADGKFVTLENAATGENVFIPVPSDMVYPITAQEANEMALKLTDESKYINITEKDGELIFDSNGFTEVETLGVIEFLKNKVLKDMME